MYLQLGALSRLAATPAKQASPETVVAACEMIRALLGAEDVYVLRAGDPAFIRIGCDDDPATYEIKQRGYWHAWREAAAHPDDTGSLLTARERLVEEIAPIKAGAAATHFAAILPGDESNSELLIVRGPWPSGLTEEQIELISTIRPLMAYLVANVLDGQRHERLRSQMKVLAQVAEAFSQADEAESALGALATALARVSGFAWVQILLFDPNLEQVADRALNRSRHSDTETAMQARRGQQSENSLARDIRVARRLAWTRQPYLLQDTSDPNEQFLVNDELRPYYERAHVLSMGAFPVFMQDQLLGTITFSASEQHRFEKDEVDFLWALVAQAAPTIKAFQLNRELRQAEQQLRAVFSNAPVFITVIEPDGKIVLSEGAGLIELGERFALVGTSLYDFIPEDGRGALTGYIERGMAGEIFEVSVPLGGRQLQTRYAPLRDEAGTPVAVIGVTLDISEQYRAQRELRVVNSELQAAKEQAEDLARQAEILRLKAEYLASHDVLTGVLSRRAWFEVASSTSPTAVAVIDIDTFKGINDSYGHPAGDLVLRNVAERLAGAIRDEGVLGRLGGEEFGVLFTIPLSEAERVCRRAVDIIGSMPCLLPGGALLSVTVSAGLAQCRRIGGDAQGAIDRAYEAADRALYAAKGAGRHRLVVALQAA